MYKDMGPLGPLLTDYSTLYLADSGFDLRTVGEPFLHLAFS